MNIGKVFLHTLVKNFHFKSKMHKILNKSTVKGSHSWMENIDSIIFGHRNTLNTKQKSFRNNCRKKDSCPCFNV